MKKFFVLSLLVLLLSFGGVGCRKNYTPKHVAAVSTNGIAAVLNAGVRLDASLSQAKVLSPSETKEYAKLIDEAASDNDRFIETVRNLPAVDPKNKQQVIQLFETFSANLSNNFAAFHVKNPDSQKKITEWMATVQIALAGVDAFLQSAGVGQTGKQLADGVTAAAENGGK